MSSNIGILFTLFIFCDGFFIVIAVVFVIQFVICIILTLKKCWIFKGYWSKYFFKILVLKKFSCNDSPCCCNSYESCTNVYVCYIYHKILGAMGQWYNCKTVWVCPLRLFNKPSCNRINIFVSSLTRIVNTNKWWIKTVLGWPNDCQSFVIKTPLFFAMLLSKIFIESLILNIPDSFVFFYILPGKYHYDPK